MRKITIIHPSRSRYIQCKSTADLFLSNAKYPENIRYIVSIDASDIFTERYFTIFDNTKILVDINNNNSCIKAINNTAEKCLKDDDDIIMVVSDDFDCEKNWDEKILNTIGNSIDFVLKTYDGTEGWIVTLPILDYIYYKRFFHIYNPIYRHLFCDTELTHVAEITGHLIIDNNIKFIQTFINDNQKKNTDLSWKDGEFIYISRVKKQFDLDDSEIVQELSYKPHIDWLTNKLKEYE